MERLTERIKRLQKDDLIVYTNGKYEDTIPAEMTNDDIRAVLKKLAAYEDLEEQGLLVRLPCRVGDILFRINKGARNPIIKMKVSRITIISKSYNIKAIEEDCGEVFFSNDVIGIKVFLSREEAEKKLEEMKAND
jgi:hypothetical protein